MTDDNLLPCQAKMAFNDKKTAQAAATVALFQHGTSLKVYRCKYCGLWHLASA